MKRKLLICFFVALLSLSVGFLFACGNDPAPDPKPSPIDPSKKVFTGITFTDKTVDYDGLEYTIDAIGVPDFATVVYTNHGPFTNSGTYAMTATISAENYNTLSLSATLRINKLTYDMSNAKWNYTSPFDYDGTEKEVLVTGLPAGVTVNHYTDNKFTNAGNYTASVSLDYDTVNHNAPSIANCTWVIEKKTFDDVIFNNLKVEYDAKPHTIAVEGNLPQEAQVNYVSNVKGITNTATNIGNYNVTATITAANFETLTLKATLIITADDYERSMAVSGDTLFFQNALDGDKFYAYDFVNDKIVKISNDRAINIIPTDDDEVAFVSQSLLFPLVKSANYNSSTYKATTDVLFHESARYIIDAGNDIFYFAINGFTKESSGIYKIDLSQSEPQKVLLSVGKADYLQLLNNKIYFADGSNGDKLSYINLSSPSTRYTLVDKDGNGIKIHNLILDDGIFYFTVNNLLGDYIAKYNPSSGAFIKLTVDAGINLCVVGNDLYYINADLLTSKIFGKGIYKVSTKSIIDYNLPGTKVIDSNDFGICSLYADDDNLYYYDVNGYKLMKYDISSATSENLLEGFVKPEDPAPTSFGSEVRVYGNTIYYLDVYDGKTLHAYNKQTKMNVRVTSDKVSCFEIIGDYLYFNAVTYLVNNTTYRINLLTGDTPQLINKLDAVDFVSDGTYIYFVKKNGAAVRTAIMKQVMDGSSDPVEIFSYGAENLVLYNGTLYFSAKGAVQTYIQKIENVANVTTPQEKTYVSSDYTSDIFAISNGVIYFRENYGLGNTKHRLAKMNIDGTNYSVMVTTNSDPVEIIVSNGYVYYANSAQTANDFDLYKIDINQTEGSELALTTDMHASAICIDGNVVYFVDYNAGGLLGDSHLYSVPISGGTATKLA